MNMTFQKSDNTDSCRATDGPDRQNNQTPPIDTTTCSSPSIAAEAQTVENKCPSSPPSVKPKLIPTSASGVSSVSSDIHKLLEKRQRIDPSESKSSLDEQQLPFNDIASLLSVLPTSSSGVSSVSSDINKPPEKRQHIDPSESKISLDEQQLPLNDIATLLSVLPTSALGVSSVSTTINKPSEKRQRVDPSESKISLDEQQLPLNDIASLLSVLPTSAPGVSSVSSAINKPSEKRQRVDPSESESSLDEQYLSFNSIESLLSVPISYILRKTSSQNKSTPLLSRMEASLLIQITTLSYELDTLLQISIEAVEKSHDCKKFSRNIDESRNVFLRPLHCLLHTHGRIIPQQVVQHVQNHLEGILGHFPIIIQSLRQCAEQNWSMSNALLGMSADEMGIGVLGKEKGHLAEMQEEVCKRMEGLMDGCNHNGLSINNSFDEETMECFCGRLFSLNKSDREDEKNGSAGGGLLLSMQSRTESICDAASTLGMLAASSGASTSDV
jgi:hypothetical protein